MAWARVLLMLASTLAGSKHDGAPSKKQGTCPTLTGLLPACADLDRAVRPEHVLAPFLLAYALLLVIYAPTLFLASRTRVRDLWAAVAQVSVSWPALAAVAYAYLWLLPSLAYALALHLSLLFIRRRTPPTLVLGTQAHGLARATAMAALLLGAWQAGPPLPVIDTPGASFCCGAAMHLLAWGLAETAGWAAVALAECWWRACE